MALGDDESTPRAIDFPIIGSFGAYDFLSYFLQIPGSVPTALTS